MIKETGLKQFIQDNLWGIIMVTVSIIITWTMFGARLTSLEKEVFEVQEVYAEDCSKMEKVKDEWESQITEIFIVLENIETKLDLLLEGKLNIE